MSARYESANAYEGKREARKLFTPVRALFAISKITRSLMAAIMLFGSSGCFDSCNTNEDNGYSSLSKELSSQRLDRIKEYFEKNIAFEGLKFDFQRVRFIEYNLVETSKGQVDELQTDTVQVPLMHGDNVLCYMQFKLNDWASEEEIAKASEELETYLAEQNIDSGLVNVSNKKVPRYEIINVNGEPININMTQTTFTDGNDSVGVKSEVELEITFDSDEDKDNIAMNLANYIVWPYYLKVMMGVDSNGQVKTTRKLGDGRRLQYMADYGEIVLLDGSGAEVETFFIDAFDLKVFSSSYNAGSGEKSVQRYTIDWLMKNLLQETDIVE